MNRFIEAVKNMFRIEDLRNRVLFTLALLAVYRLGGHIPTPGIDTNKLEEFFRQNQGTLFGYLDVFSGGSFRRLTIFALGIMPYITASIILQLLVVGAAVTIPIVFQPELRRGPFGNGTNHRLHENAGAVRTANRRVPGAEASGRRRCYPRRRR